MVMQKAQVRHTKPRRARRTRKDKSKLMCFPFEIFVFFVVQIISDASYWSFPDNRIFSFFVSGLIGENIIQTLQIVDHAPIAAALFNLAAPILDARQIFLGIHIIAAQLGDI